MGSFFGILKKMGWILSKRYYSEQSVFQISRRHLRICMEMVYAMDFF